MGKRRAVVLIAIHIAIAAHIVHWKIAGSTLSPVEPSEAMQTLELGKVNAGFIFLIAALLATLVFGRFFCGWGCHLVALQDLCGWMMKKIGVHPKPFRTRLLIFAPVALAIYMFIWPSLNRLIFEQTPLPADGFTNSLTTTDFWETFASIAIGIPFLGICGFLCVYFLGAKGFCTYGCPYGGLFGPLDKVALGRIVVDKNKCKGSGHCTPACTSNVRVHEEVREFGSVTNPGCMKCLDCVSVCPNDALSWKLTPPPIFSKRSKTARIKPNYDTSIPEEIALGIFALAVFFAVRGAYAVIPMLMAVGISASLTFMAWKAWRMLRDHSARIAFAQLKIKQQITPIGSLFLAITVLLTLLTAHTGYVNYHRWRGGHLFNTINIPLTQLLSGATVELDDPTNAQVSRALNHLTKSGSIADGGVGLAWHPQSMLQAAHLNLASGNPETTAALLASLIKTDHASDRLAADYARVLILSGDRATAEQHLKETTTNHADYWECRNEYLSAFPDSISPKQAIADTRAALDGIDDLHHATPDARTQTLLILARLHERVNDTPSAIEAYRSAVESNPDHAQAQEHLASALLRLLGDVDGAIEHLTISTTLNPSNTRAWSYLSQLHHKKGNTEAFLKACDGAIASAATLIERESLTRNVAMMLIQLGYEQQADEYVERADKLKAELSAPDQAN